MNKSREISVIVFSIIMAASYMVIDLYLILAVYSALDKPNRLLAPRMYMTHFVFPRLQVFRVSRDIGSRICIVYCATSVLSQQFELSVVQERSE